MSRSLRRVVFTAPSLFFFLAATFIFPFAGRSQFAGPIMVNSVSGQFVVTAGPQFSPLMHDPVLATNVNYIRLDPPLLAISAERFRQVAWDQLGLKPDAPWTGKIFLALHPARTQDEAAGIAVGPFLKQWSCRVELPDIVMVPRYGRALSAALLLELASRHQMDASRVPEIPAWLADGLAQMTFARDADTIILSVPAKAINGLSETRINRSQRGMDSAAVAIHKLQGAPALSFDQLCWPNDQQINGQDGGVYLASAQLFTSHLLSLPDGQNKLQKFLAALPTCLNWQTAFFEAFGANFKRPVDVEKWWSLLVVRFNAHDPGPHWTDTYSRDRLADLVTVPVEYRSSSNSLPVHMDASLQAAVRGFSADERELVLQDKMRDLRMAEVRLTPMFAMLAAGYAQALADFLGEGQKPVPTVINKQVVNERHTASAAVTIQKLDLLDARRREAEAQLKPEPTPAH